MQNPANVLTKIPTGLDPIFHPQNIAVVGATEREGSVGRTIFWNLISSPFGGTVYPVNPTRNSILGVRAYPSLKDVPDKIDLVVLVTPAKSIPALIREAVDLGIKGAVIISAGFKEVGAEGVALERQVLAEARRGGMRIIGPNCLGECNICRRQRCSRRGRLHQSIRCFAHIGSRLE